ncbi:MAG: agmatine deiminase family protein [Deltaproteobacteria bacterium]|nr:agmatine deiminase family protein [Deltaproteobacteria bacterium]
MEGIVRHLERQEIWQCLAVAKRTRKGMGSKTSHVEVIFSAHLAMLKQSLNTPKKLGYFMPAEWERHDAIWLSWPHDPITFPDRVEKVEKTYAEIIKALQPGEKVNLFVQDLAMKTRAQGILKESGVNHDEIVFHVYEYADVWFRDYGPIFLVNKKSGGLAMSHWIFNGWGGKYETLMKDTRIPEFVNRGMNIPCFTPGIVMEGGSIDVNGKGMLLTTEQCLLNKNRNPHLNKSEIEDYLREYLGVSHIIWLKNGIEGDDTDGHIDDIARFVNPTTVLCAYEENRNDVNHPALHENYEILCHAKDQSGNRLNVVKLPMPPHQRFWCRGMPGALGDAEGALPASYANFYIGNTVVLVPVFGHRNDDKALDIIQRQFPDRKVAGINCADLVYGLGTLHCISQQQPKA